MRVARMLLFLHGNLTISQSRCPIRLAFNIPFFFEPIANSTECPSTQVGNAGMLQVLLPEQHLALRCSGGVPDGLAILFESSERKEGMATSAESRTAAAPWLLSSRLAQSKPHVPGIGILRQQLAKSQTCTCGASEGFPVCSSGICPENLTMTLPKQCWTSEAGWASLQVVQPSSPEVVWCKACWIESSPGPDSSEETIWSLNHHCNHAL